ncbi:DUF58 domain-containing protein [Alkaliphilus metalliredigens]|uniref:DUF58 domain-containing protein n=1 Tax=Alkaliphilus metalliredigens TaxID=208226 RepID=UPI0002FFEEEA|nr:DUF58 domain-containing protein [Alkaliphilus metalliredigens]
MQREVEAVYVEEDIIGYIVEWVNDLLFQNQTHISDLRPYQIGDSMKRIHWEASSKSRGGLRDHIAL